jgi:hypothetical protein
LKFIQGLVIFISNTFLHHSSDSSDFDRNLLEFIVSLHVLALLVICFRDPQLELVVGSWFGLLFFNVCFLFRSYTFIASET